MYSTILILHAITKWLVLFMLLASIFKAYQGYTFKLSFTRLDNATRHWTATVAHIQLIFGMILYAQSPLIKYFWTQQEEVSKNLEPFFFSVIHIFLMLLAITLITIGSALAKRKTKDLQKFKTMMLWYSLGLIIILIAIPWPFSPLSQRPYLRTF